MKQTSNQNNYLEIKLKGADNNTQGIGAKVSIYSNGKATISGTDAFKRISVKRIAGIAFWLGKRQSMLIHYRLFG